MDILNTLLSCQKVFREAKHVGNDNELFKELSKLSSEHPSKIRTQVIKKNIVFEIIEYDILYTSDNEEIKKFFKSSIANKLTSILGLRNNYISYSDIKERKSESNKNGFKVEISEYKYNSINTGSSYKLQRTTNKGVTVYTFTVLINEFSGCVRFTNNDSNYIRLRQSENCKLNIDIIID